MLKIILTTYETKLLVLNKITCKRFIWIQKIIGITLEPFNWVEINE